MKRKCFICNVHLKNVITDTWHLPGINSCHIGFSICPDCGLILQSPSTEISTMNEYYSRIATYTNPGRQGMPSTNKIKDVKRLIAAVKDTLGKMPKSALQVGCSDGYTLFEFKNAGVSTVEGIDPGKESHQLAKKRYDIETIVGTFEAYKATKTYELIILTHVLEHIYDPLTMLKKCALMQKLGDWVLIEVPLFERLDKFPPGMLSFEHINYFSEITLSKIIYKSGYVPYQIQKLYNNNEYPIITIVAQKEISAQLEIGSDYSRANDLLRTYCKKDKAGWRRIGEKLKNKIPKGSSVNIWGAGIHTSQLLANTDLAKHFKIEKIFDSSSTKWGIHLGNINCTSAEKENLNRGDIIIISSYASENEIYNSLEKYRKKGVKTIKLYGD